MAALDNNVFVQVRPETVLQRLASERERKESSIAAIRAELRSGVDEKEVRESPMSREKGSSEALTRLHWVVGGCVGLKHPISSSHSSTSSCRWMEQDSGGRDKKQASEQLIEITGIRPGK